MINLYSRLLQYVYLIRLHRPIGILLLLWPTLWALWIASEGKPEPLILIVFVLGVILMRSAGCVINDYADRNFDPHVARTKDRPIASGKVSTIEALVLFVILCLMAFMLVLQLNKLTILMSFVGVLLAATYPFVKRHSHLPQVYLGAAFGWAVPMAFAAQTSGVPKIAWLLFISTVVWATVYDTMYGMVDREDDIKIGVKSTAILLGESDKRVIGLLQVLFFLSLLLVGQEAGLHTYYYLGLLLAAGLAVYQQFLIRDRDPNLCFQAFLNNSWLGAFVFAGIVLDYMSQ
jgi:4-hydroxybenzoate polyprenyltransferase